MRSSLALSLALLAPLACPSLAQPSLDDLLDLAPAPEEPPDPTPQPGAADLSDLAGRLDPPGDAGDAFARALDRMDAAAGLLAEAPGGLPAARTQQEVLDLLDAVLAAATSPPPGGGGGGGEPGDPPPPTDGDAPPGGSQPAGPAPGPAGPPAPGPASAAAGENAGAPSAGAPVAAEPRGGPLDATAAGWGGLPPRLRDELTDGLDEPFSPVYRAATEDYYRRLSRRAAATPEGQP
ncbi:hypothetical protein [Phycisphaera mikurensis]|uniref:Uncharacterized protein n=1 Tax=Phycisphaera mikurensis (strain NBRC 102666 / KCTC 22515 / FYK2301M01) TaxID=1142394 RepID=I0IBQ8_PHYMF|nr:hypothetical protein [Phycisphaera mikurensis]MBB6443392.1 hypothetical protein [Phycisphaera mikurensis]BAM02696.1 hypothetical protein PSMK_05370 [Phycisphaera mikurensis NBRC 102666]